MSTILLTLLTLLVFVLVIWVAFWLIDSIGLPHPGGWIAKAIVAIIGLFVLFQKFGTGLGL